MKSLYFRTKPRSPTSIHWAFKSHLSGSVLFAPKYDTYNVTRASQSKHESHCISWASFSCSFSHLLSSLEFFPISILSHWSTIKQTDVIHPQTQIHQHKQLHLQRHKFTHKHLFIHTDTKSETHAHAPTHIHKNMSGHVMSCNVETKKQAHAHPKNTYTYTQIRALM